MIGATSTVKFKLKHIYIYIYKLNIQNVIDKYTNLNYVLQ